MPSVKIDKQSLMLTQEGWSLVSDLDFPRAVYGIDRHGRFSVEKIVFQSREDINKRVFFATESAFGFFSPNSKICDNSGKKLLVGDLVENMSVAEKYLESIPDISTLKISCKSIDEIWHVLRESAAYDDKDQLVLRCRGGRLIGVNGMGSQEIPVVKCGDRFFCTLKRDQISLWFIEDWAKTIRELAEIWLKTNDGVFELKRSEYVVGMWLLSALRGDKNDINIICDTQQHTVLVLVEMVDGQSTRAVKRGVCAFYILTPSEEVTIGWSNSSWNPIVNGVVLASG